MTDNRANEPTPEQVETAAKEFERVWDENIDSFDPEQHDAMSYIKTAMRAALVATQGAAPQAEIEVIYCPEHGDLLAGNRSTRCANAPIGHEYAAPVLPSSRVDEERLAEVIRKLRFNDAGCWAGGIDCTESVSDHADDIARAVAEWLKGQGRGSEM